MQIDRATVDDLDAIVAGWLDLASEMRSYGAHVETDANRETIRRQFAYDVVAGRVHAARDDDELVGFLAYRFPDDDLSRDVRRAYVTYVWVHPDHRNQGVGSRLFDAVEAATRDAGADVVTLDVLANNTAARRFYERRGYTDHRVEMELDLPEGAGENDTH